MPMQTEPAGKLPKADIPSHLKLWKRIFFVLSVSLYLVVVGFIYREWIMSFRISPDDQAREARATENRINYKYFTGVGLQYNQAHDYQKAELAFRKAVEYAPDEALGYSNLGSALSGQQKWDEAILILEKAVSLDPTLQIAKNNLEYAKTEKAKKPGLK
jgi:tetratricopeptide (TPR) repeat protein